MSAFSAILRARITERAGHRCEYCHLPTRGQVATFPIDHVIPKSAGGTNEEENLALGCPHCNAQKWKTSEAVDPISGNSVVYFNPRVDIWNEHFRWSSLEVGRLLGSTPVGRATIAGLDLNHPRMIELRSLLAHLGLFAEVDVGSEL